MLIRAIRLKVKAVLIPVLLILIVLFVILFRNSFISFLASNHLLPEPEKFTELYFENHDRLPSKVETGQPYIFAFSVHSEEHQSVDYKYIVFIQTEKEKLPVQTGNFSLKQDEKKTFDEKFTAPKFTNKAKVVVDLVNKNQNIDFWITQ